MEPSHPDSYDIHSLPSESIVHFLCYLSVKQITHFCSTSSKFLIYLRNSKFWKTKSLSIPEEEMSTTFTESVKFGILPLTNILIHKLSNVNFNTRQIEKIFWRIMNSEKLILISKMLETFDWKLSEVTCPSNKLRKEYPEETDFYKIFEKLYASSNTLYQPSEEVNKIIYSLLLDCRSCDIDDFDTKLTSVLISCGGPKSVDYILNRILQEENWESFYPIFFQIMHCLHSEDEYDEFVRLWNCYNDKLNGVEEFCDSIQDSDKYPYRYIKALDIDVNPDKIYEDLLDCADLNTDLKARCDLFSKIWKDFNSELDRQDKKRLLVQFRTKGENVFIFIMKGGIIGDITIRLVELIKEGNVEEFGKYWNENKTNLSDMEREFIDGITPDNFP